MNNLLIVAAGGAIGAALRYVSNNASAWLLGTAFPWGTFLINVAGSLAMGLLAGWLARRGAQGTELRLFLATGVLGGFTTFSAFSLDFATVWQRGEHVQAMAYAAGSVVLSLAAVFAGLALMRSA